MNERPAEKWTDGKVKRIAFITPQNRFFDLMCDRLRRYALDRPGWLIQPGMVDLSARSFSLEADAAIVSGGIPGLYEKVAGLGIPTLSVLTMPKGRRVPCVKVDNAAVGRLAANHLLSLGYRHFGFVGVPGEVDPRTHRLTAGERMPSEALRRQAFRGALRGKAETLSVAPAYNLFYEQHRALLVDWIRKQPRPTAFFCASDSVGSPFANLCRMEGLSVPGQVVILGVDNNEEICALTRPSLSSIAIPWDRMGEILGGMLDEVFDKGRVKTTIVRIPPSGVMTRGSTGPVVADDEVVAKTLRRLREKAFEPGNLKELFDDLPTSRRQIERHFRSVIGHSPLQELWRIRLHQASVLLKETTRSYQQIALSSGFSGSTQMRRVFMKLIGQTPQQVRKPQKK